MGVWIGSPPRKHVDGVSQFFLSPVTQDVK